MEHESDNPFRPDESLYHEVDPIVKAYSRRPFPPSPTGSPIPPDLTPIKNGRHVTLDSNSVTVIDGSNKLVRQPPNPNHAAITTALDTSTPQKHNISRISRQQGNGGAHDIPPPNNVELIHVDNKKKKCACCSVL